MRINWDAIHDNSSSADALYEFVHGASIKRAVEYCWDPEVKKIFGHLQKLPVKTARRRARDFWRKNFA